MYNELLSALIKRAKDYLYSIEGSKKSVIERRYGYLWNRILIDLGDIKNISQEDISKHCISYYGKDLINLEQIELTQCEKIIKKSLLTLLEFKNTNHIDYIPMQQRKRIIDIFSSTVLTEYNEYQKNLGLKETTILSKEKDIKYFLKNYPLQNLSEQDILDYIASFKMQQPYSARLTMNKIKNFLKYAKSKQYIKDDFEYLFPTHAISSTGSIASTYDNDEISKVIEYYKNSNDECSKRNYAIILILAIYGLRARDIIMLSYDDIDWNTDVLKFTTSKTNIVLEYSLIALVGNAIIDYILNERPKSNSKRIFLLKNGQEISSSQFITSIVGKAFSSSKIDIKDKHYGAHSLRSSLATRMLNEHTPIFTISKALGHASIDTTKIYTKVDIPHLKLCALEVIPYEL